MLLHRRRTDRERPSVRNDLQTSFDRLLDRTRRAVTFSAGRCCCCCCCLDRTSSRRRTMERRDRSCCCCCWTMTTAWMVDQVNRRHDWMRRMLVAALPTVRWVSTTTSAWIVTVAMMNRRTCLKNILKHVRWFNKSPFRLISRRNIIEK